MGTGARSESTEINASLQITAFDRDTYALGMLSPTMRLQLALLIKLTALCQKS